MSRGYATPITEVYYNTSCQVFLMELSQIKKVHCLGIGGIGVSAVAKFFLAQGKEVSGSDLARSEITEDLEKRGVKIFYGHKSGQIDPQTDLIVYSPAVSLSNPEILDIKDIKDIKILSYPEFLGELSKEYYTIAVSGTHGKSTTTAMIGLILEAAGFDPLVIVGARVPGWEMGNLRLPRGTYAELNGTNAELSGRRRFFVVEACEHQANMLKIHPHVVVVTSVEPDHLDYYQTFDNVKAAFQAFTQLVAKGGLVVYNGDREAEWNWNYIRPSVFKLLWQMLFGMKLKWRSFGFGEGNDYRALDWQVKEGHQEFEMSLLRHDLKQAHVRLQIPGRFNVYNALAALTVALELGVPIEVCQKVLANFKGIWRRFEIVGQMRVGNDTATVISDYGHHPTAIRETLRGAREFYPGRRIVLVYQPHQHHRTKSLWEEFIKALAEPDVLILSEIYEVVGREAVEDREVSSQKLIDSLKTLKTLKTLKFFYGGDLEQTERLARQVIKEEDVVIVMGAGDIDKVARKLVMTKTRI